VLAATALVVAAGCGGGGQVGAATLATQGESLQSVAAEGALLSLDAAAGRSTSTFTDEHARELRRVAAKTTRTLASEQSRSAPVPLAELTRLGTRIRSDLGRIGGATSVERARLARELDAAAARAGRIVRRLQRA
jgi:hypothetical protein